MTILGWTLAALAAAVVAVEHLWHGYATAVGK